ERDFGRRTKGPRGELTPENAAWCVGTAHRTGRGARRGQSEGVQRLALPHHPGLLARPGLDLSVRPGRELERRLPLHPPQQGGKTGDRDGRQRNVARLPGARAQPAVGALAPAGPHPGIAATANRVWKVLSVSAGGAGLTYSYIGI